MSENNSNVCAVKHDQEKPKISLLDSDWLCDTAKAVDYIYTKLSKENTDNDISTSLIYNNMMQLLLNWNKGQDVDKESKLKIMHLVSAWSMIMSCHPKTRQDIKTRLTQQSSSLLALLESSWITGCANVMTFGAKKYKPYGWADGFPFTRVYNALMRHLLKLRLDCQAVDHESTFLHIYHLGCNAMMLSVFSKTKPGLDDRHNKPSISTS